MSREAALTKALGAAPRQIEPLAGGCVGEVLALSMPDGTRLVAKLAGRGEARLDVEARMLVYLREHTALPVPAVVHASPELLVMTWLPGSSRALGAAADDAARLIAALHDIGSDRFGFDSDTSIGGLPQPNPWTSSWCAFFAEHRLLHMARQAEGAGRLDAGTRARVERLAGRVDALLPEPPAPSLLHGDLWSGNLLAQDGRITGLLDPAIYFGHAEIELAFTTLFGTFDQHFFAAYHERRPIEPGFFEERRDLYNLYPLLVHVRLFRGGYVGEVESALGGLGF